MATRVEKDGIEACIGKVNKAIEELSKAAKQIDDSMNELPNYWEGAAYNKARTDYESQYQNFLLTTVPTAVEDFRNYINGCKDKIIELDQQLAGN